MDTNAITRQLETARADVARLNSLIHELERERDVAAGKVEAFELSLRYIEDMKPNSEKSKKKRNRMPSSDWQKVFGALYPRYQSGFDYDIIMDVASSVGVPLKRPSLRTKMMNLTDAGHVEKLSDGEFRINQQGAKYFGLTSPETNEASNPIPAEASRVVEDVGASSNQNPNVSLPVWPTTQG